MQTVQRDVRRQRIIGYQAPTKRESLYKSGMIIRLDKSNNSIKAHNFIVVSPHLISAIESET